MSKFLVAGRGSRLIPESNGLEINILPRLASKNLLITDYHPFFAILSTDNLNIFDTSLWCLKRFLEGLKCLYKAFLVNTKKYENKNSS